MVKEDKQHMIDVFDIQVDRVLLHITRRFQTNYQYSKSVSLKFEVGMK